MEPIVGVLMTSINAGGQNMINVLTKLNWKFKLLGNGEKFTGWSFRMQQYVNFLKTLHPERVAILVDAYDALAVRSPDGFLELFESFNNDIVVGAESYCFVNCRPLTNRTQNTSFQSVQGGCIIGKAQHLILMYEWILNENIQDDQMGIASYMNNHQDLKIDLDQYCKLSFHDNWGKSSEFDFSNGVQVTRNEITTNPFFIHFPGFLMPQTVFQIFSPKSPIPLKSYSDVGKFLLSDQFIDIVQYDRLAYEGFNTTLIILLTLFVVTIIILSVFVHKKSSLVRKLEKKKKIY